MDKKTLLDELLEYHSTQNTELVIRNRAENAIAACVNLMNLIEESFDAATASDLNNRVLLSVKNRDPSKFLRKIDTVISGK